MKHIFAQGKSIIITGPEGVGKTSLAEAIADSVGGSVVTISASQLRTGFNAEWALADTVIVDDYPAHSKIMMMHATQLAASDHTHLEEPGKNPRTIKMPNFIFATGSTEALGLGAGGHRFLVINMS